ncbi:MAG: PAS domain S-box protein, partial [Chloroflexi bacterium]|nr:PAS domain S-box protein [Chloroflexota bacterium]
MRKKPTPTPATADPSIRVASGQALRRQAEAKLSARQKKAKASAAKKVETPRLVHELQVHQIELEMQNEELAHSRAETESLLRQYSDLYDFAPIGYFTLARDDVIRQANLTGARLLGVERGALIKRRFGLFVSPQSRSTYNAFLEKVSKSGRQENCEIALLKNGSESIWAHIEATCSDDGQECHIVVIDITERKRAEEEYRTIIGTALDGFWITNMQGRFLDVNDAYCNLIGYSREELLTLSIPDVEAVEKPEEIAAHIRKITEVGRDHFETRHRCKDGRSVDIEVSTNYIKEEGRIFAFLRDITERKRAEEALRESEKRFRSVIEDITELICRFFPDGTLTYVNDVYCHYVGKSREELIGTNFIPLAAADLPQKLRDHFRLLTPAHPISTFEQYDLLPTGEKCWREWVDRGVFDEHGHLIEIQSTGRDITERNRAEEALRESENRLRLIIEGTQALLVSVDAQGHFIYANEATARAVGYVSSEELIGKPYLHFIHREDRQQVFDTFTKQVNARQLSSMQEFRLTDTAGEVKWFSFLSTLTIKDGQVVGQSGVAQDITARKQAEEA